MMGLDDQGLDDATLTGEAEYCLSLHCNGNKWFWNKCISITFG